jgi:acylpyruvate hydrolase
MKLATIKDEGANQTGVLIGDEILIPSRHPDLKLASADFASMKALLGSGEAQNALKRAIDQAITPIGRERLQEAGALRPRGSCRLLAPLPNPSLILAVGMNYRHHLEKMNVPIPAEPSAFIKVPDTITGPGMPIVIPKRFPSMVDFEGELTIVMGRHCHNLDREEAAACIAGYTIANDVSARDWVGEVFASQAKFETIYAWGKNTLGKNLPTFAPTGPVITTVDEMGDLNNVRIRTHLNGTLMQDSLLDDMIFDVPTLVSYFSRWFRFSPGDLICTGTPSGCGFERKPPQFMKSGDTVEVEIDGIGVLSNPLVSAD